jgi:hypothetical protein
MKYMVYVTESIDHSYEVEANSREEALEIYYTYNTDQLKQLDLDANVTWDKPWGIEESE